MRQRLTAIMAAAMILATPVAAQQPADALSRMFVWWDQAFKTPGAFTAENFSRYFTPDATLTLEGRTVIRGVNQWATHFQKIQAGGGDVEIVVPFKAAFQQGDRLYTYHVIRSRRDGKLGCVLAAGHAELRGGKIASITLVRAPVDLAKGPPDPACWTK
ncbi:hypothetical protein ACYZX9_14105 [Sphingomonas citri]